MKRFIATKADNDYFKIEGSEHNHLKNVLRFKVGDELVCIINDKYDYNCKIIKIEKSFTMCKVMSKSLNIANAKKDVTMFQALTKKDNMNLIVQKLNELGITNLYPFESEYTTVKNKANKQLKLQEVAFQSSKQCGRSISMKVHAPLNFKELLIKLSQYKTVILANENEVFTALHSTLNINKNSDNIAIIVGSEGGFSSHEIKKLQAVKGLISVSLGRRILRAETASIALSAIVLSLINEI